LFTIEGKQIRERELPARGTSEVILKELEALLAAAKIKKEDLTGVAAMLGPGSFTGLRVGLAFANSLALGLDIPMLGIEKDCSEIKSGKFEKQWLRPIYGGEANVTKRKRAG
jgi:tRNA threonylcarbamoyl adenosine modification protein YeaZ